jgi:ABC-type polysaccharide/polyol phosphate export permease
MLRDLLAYRSFIKNMVLRDLKLKYRDSVIGVVWSIFNPLLMLAVYTIAFRYIIRIPMENYLHFLVVGLVPWHFFSASTIASTSSVLGNAALIRQVSFPRETLPVATVLCHFVQLLLTLTVLLPLLVIASGAAPSWTALLFPPVLILHLGFTIGVALILSALTTLYRDIAHLTEVGLLLLFWLTPIVYPVSMAPPGLQRLLAMNPSGAFALAYQDVLFWGRRPPALLMATLVLWTAGLLLTGRLVFRSYSQSFAERA